MDFLVSSTPQHFKALATISPDEEPRKYTLKTERFVINVSELSSLYGPCLNCPCEIDIYVYKSGESIVVEIVPDDNIINQLLFNKYRNQFCGTIESNNLLRSKHGIPFLKMFVSTPRSNEYIVAFNNEIISFEKLRPLKTFFFTNIERNQKYSNWEIRPETKIIPYNSEKFPRLTTLEEFDLSGDNLYLLHNNLAILAMVCEVRRHGCESRGERRFVELDIADKNGYPKRITIFGSYRGIVNEFEVGKFVVIFHMTRYYQIGSKDIVVL